MTWAVSPWRPILVAVAALAAAFAGGYAAHGKPPAPAVALHEDNASQRASATASDTSDSKGAVRITRTEEEFGASAPCSVGPATADHEVAGIALSAERSVRPPVPIRRTVTVEERGPEVITQHATEQTTQAEQSHVSLVVTPPVERPGWAFGGSIEDVPGARLLRLELDRRLFGNLWLTAGVVPARREVGIGLRMEW